MFEYRYARTLFNGADQTLAAPGNHQIYIFILLQKFRYCGAVIGVDQLNGIGGQTGFHSRAAHSFCQYQIGTQRFGAAFQDHSIAAFDRHGSGVGSYIGARFIDHCQYADGYSYFLHLQTAGHNVFFQNFAHRIGPRGGFFKAFDHIVKNFIIHAQTFLESGSKFSGALQIQHIRSNDLFPAGKQFI